LGHHRSLARDQPPVRLAGIARRNPSQWAPPSSAWS
jgi:hypothetical protein